MYSESNSLARLIDWGLATTFKGSGVLKMLEAGQSLTLRLEFWYSTEVFKQPSKLLWQHQK